MQIYLAYESSSSRGGLSFWIVVGRMGCWIWVRSLSRLLSSRGRGPVNLHGLGVANKTRNGSLFGQGFQWYDPTQYQGTQNITEETSQPINFYWYFFKDFWDQSRYLSYPLLCNRNNITHYIAENYQKQTILELGVDRHPYRV